MGKHNWYLLSLLLLLLPASGCQKLLPPEETEPPVVLDIGTILASSTFQTVATFGQGYDRYAGILTQHMSGHEAIAANMSCYALEPEFFNAEFNHIYLDVFANLEILIEAAIEQDAWAYVGAAQVLTAMNLGYLTDIYGDIPWTQALLQENLFPKYDSQELIYQEIQRLLNEALEHLDKTSAVSLDAGDIFFNGDLNKWKITALVLQARYHNHLSKRYPSQSAADALIAIDRARNLGLSAESDFSFPFDGINFKNPWSDAVARNLPVSNVFINLMQEKQDPRLSSYFSKAANGEYLGYPIHCYAQNGSGFSTINPSGFVGQANAPLLLVSYFEALFIEAEAAYRAGDKMRAADALNDAVRASVEKVTDADPNLQETIQKYYNTSASETVLSVDMEKIMTEKFIAMFSRNIESWVDVRRHDYQYPTFLQVPHSEVGVPAFEQFIRRVPYPHTEHDNNPDNVPEVGIFEPLWWDE